MKIRLFEKIPVTMRAAVAFVIANTITQGLTLLSTPLFVRLMTTAEIGVVTNFNTWSSVLTIIINMVLYANSYSIAMKEYSEDRSGYTSVALTFSMVSTLLFFLIFLLFREPIEQLMEMDFRMVCLMFMGFMFVPATNFWMARQRFEYKYIAVLLVSVISAVLSVFCAVLAVVIATEYQMDLPFARLSATYAISIAFGIFFAVVILKKGKKIYDSAYLKFILVVNTPMIIHALSKTLLDASDRIMITSLVGKSEAGIYGTLYSISSLIMVVWNAINSATVPYFFNGMKEIDKSVEGMKKNTIFILGGFSAVALLFSMIAPEFIKLFTTDVYYDAISIVPPIIIGCYITALYSMFGNVLLFNKKTTSMMFSTILACIVNIILNYFMIPRLGYQAAAYTTIAGYAALSLFMYGSMKRIKNKTAQFLDMKSLLVLSGITIACISISYVIYPFTLLRYSLLLLVLFVAFFFRKKIILFARRLNGGK